VTTLLESPPRRETESATPVNRWRLLYALTVGLSALAGFAFLGRSSLYLDEAVSTTIASAPWHRFTQSVLHREVNAVFYYVVLRGWAHIGHSEFAVRSLSVLAGVAAVAILILVARDLFGRRAALVAGVLLAVDPLLVELAQDTRGYALSLLLVVASSALFVRGIQRSSSWATWAGYAVVSALAAYANFWAALVPLAHAVSLAFLPPGRIPWRRVVPTGIALALLLVPLGLLIRSNDSAGTNWASGTSAGHVFTKVRDKVPHAAIDVGAVLAVAVAIGLVVVVRRRTTASGTGDRWPLLFAVSWLVVPLAAVVLLSFAYKPLLVVRYLVVCLPPAAMLVGAALAHLSPRLLGAGLAVLVALSGVGLGHWYQHGPGEDWGGAVTTVASRSAPGDGVVVFPAYMRIPFEWYLHDHPGAATRLQPVFPRLGWNVDVLRFDSDVPVASGTVSTAARGHARVWLVLSQSDLYPTRKHAVLDGLGAAGLSPVRSFTFTGVRVVEYVSASGVPR
jgi:mannosyltransferase